MKPDYAKATAELLERLRKRASMEVPLPHSSQVYINAPKDCVIVISPTPNPPTPKRDQQA